VIGLCSIILVNFISDVTSSTALVSTHHRSIRVQRKGLMMHF